MSSWSPIGFAIILGVISSIGFGSFGTPCHSAEDVKYSVAEWTEKGFGNHRAVVRVSSPVDAVRVHIEWRRRDSNPEKKAVLVYDQTGKLVMNAVALKVEREYGEIVFQPTVGDGDYYVYYLPYNPGVANFDDPGTYFEPGVTADPAWISRSNLKPANSADIAWMDLPSAQVVEIQARGEFNRMDPMEVTATPDEVGNLIAKASDKSYLLFPEDRKYPIRMIDDIPLKWIRSGPGNSFEGTAQPGEYYVFQIGVFAAKRSIENLSLDFSGLKSASGKIIPASAFHCINLGGRDWLGKPFTKAFNVNNGSVRALWIGFEVPKDAAGLFTGAVKVTPKGMPSTAISLRISVKGAYLPDHGEGDLWRMARLRWLDSTLGLDDKIIPPYTPVKVNGSTVSILGRKITFGVLGLPVSIAAGREVLAKPMTFDVITEVGTAKFAPSPTKIVKHEEGVAALETISKSSDFDLAVSTSTEFDGTVFVKLILRAKKNTTIKDIRLQMPLNSDVAKYMVGFSKRGGFRPVEWKWKWNIAKPDNMVWLGDYDAGVQLKLMTDEDLWQTDTLKDSGLPIGWANGGKGGCDVLEQDKQVMLNAYTGGRSVKAGESLEFRFRLMVTPFKPLDANHWNWRYGPPENGGNILHVHHATPQNPYINYPFIFAKELKELVKSVNSTPGADDAGKVTYKADGNINSRQGAVHIWVKVNFDPATIQTNHNLFSVDYPNEDQIGFYWNHDDRGMRAYLRKGSPSLNVYPVIFVSHSPEWKQGEKHLVSMTWGDGVRIYVDGQFKAESGPYAGTLDTPLTDATITLSSFGFGVDALKISNAPYSGGLVVQSADTDTLLLDTFTKWDGDDRSVPDKITSGGFGMVSGEVDKSTDTSKSRLSFKYKLAKMGVNLYYTVRELSNHVVEMWPLRSLGDEVFTTGEVMLYTDKGAVMSSAGGGYPWLKEHLVTGYVPGWRQPLGNGDHDAAIGTQGLSRWHNYYIEGMQWLMKNTGIDGLYLDGIGYDREIMKRIAKVMYRNNPNYRMNFHSGNNYDYLDNKLSPVNEYLEHLPYTSNLWFGEGYDYDSKPDYWLTEISGIPFGLTSEMLNYDNGGNAYRGMIYGMTGRMHLSASAMWKFWDKFGIQTAEWIGYWNPACPVRTDNPDIPATVYRNKGKTLISIASWASDKVDVKLLIDWKLLGLDSSKCKIHAPYISNFQDARDFTVDCAIPVEPKKGWLILID